MLTRRDALLGMGMTALVTSVAPASAFAGLLPIGGDSEQAKAADNAGLENRLRTEMAQQGARATSEEGVAVLLACVNLVPDKGPAPRTTSFNAAVANEFRRVTATWQRIQPNAPESDVAKLIQAMADRDAANGGNGDVAL